MSNPLTAQDMACKLVMVGTYTHGVDNLYRHDIHEDGSATVCGIDPDDVPENVELPIACECGCGRDITCPACLGKQ